MIIITAPNNNQYQLQVFFRGYNGIENILEISGTFVDNTLDIVELANAFLTQNTNTCDIKVLTPDGEKVYPCLVRDIREEYIHDSRRVSFCFIETSNDLPLIDTLYELYDSEDEDEPIINEDEPTVNEEE